MAEQGGRKRGDDPVPAPDDDGAFATDDVDVEPGVPPAPLIDEGSPT
jgi:hypothetical protein